MNLEGRIDILLTRCGDAPLGATIHSTRPQLAQKLLGGRTPEEAAHLAGLIFSLCGKAQRVAAEAACEAARGSVPDAATHRERNGTVLQELAQEHAWRLLLDWPQQAGAPLGIAPDMPSLLALRKTAESSRFGAYELCPTGTVSLGTGVPLAGAAESLRFSAYESGVPLAGAAGAARRFAEALDALLRTTLLGEPAAAWLRRDLAGFDAWRRSGNTPTARLFSGLGEGADTGISQATLLPPLHRLEDAAARDLAQRALDTPAFCGRPLWHGAPAETGALARMSEQPVLAAWIAQRGRGAGARLLARLLELAELPARLSGNGPTLVRAWRLGDNGGLAGVETSRGLLLHGVVLREGKVAEYRIVAPTEWNFHPAGPLAQALASLAAGATAADLKARAGLVAQSLDPCVAYGIEVNDA
jgi:hypothetical protein